MKKTIALLQRIWFYKARKYKYFLMIGANLYREPEVGEKVVIYSFKNKKDMEKFKRDYFNKFQKESCVELKNLTPNQATL
jgi:hypothetical protein